MGKSKIAILVIAIVLICGISGVTFAAYSVTRGATVDINTGDSVSVEVSVDSDVFKGEDKAQLVPRQAHILFDSGTKVYADEKINDKGITNKTAFMGKFTIKVSGDKVDRLKFSAGKVFVVDKTTNERVEIADKLDLFFLKGYDAKFSDRYAALNGAQISNIKKDMPHYLGAVWDETAKKYVGGSIKDSEAAGPFVPSVLDLHTFTVFVQFKELATNVSDNLNNKVLSFEINVAAL